MPDGSRIDEVQAAARPYYHDLQYHNWEHVQTTVDAAEELLARCWQYDVAVDESVVLSALYFHDANYRENHKAMGYDSKEAYSAAIARDELDRLGFTPDTIQDVEEAILATEPDATYDTAEQKVVRAADLSSLMQDYERFSADSLAIREERERLEGRTIPQDEWVNDVLDTVQHYLSQDIQLTPAHDTEDGLSQFHQNAGRNLGLFLQEYSTW